MQITSVAWTDYDEKLKVGETVRIDFSDGSFVFAPPSGGRFGEYLAEWFAAGNQIAVPPLVGEPNNG